MITQSTLLLPLSPDELRIIVREALRCELQNTVIHSQNSTEPEETLTREETAKLLRISLPTLNSRMKNKEIPFHRNGRRIIFLRSELLQFLRELSNERQS